MNGQAEKMFNRYYDEFLLNVHRRDAWVLKFTDGREVQGTPWSEAMVSMTEPMFTFREQSGRVYTSPFSTLADAWRLVVPQVTRSEEEAALIVLDQALVPARSIVSSRGQTKLRHDNLTRADFDAIVDALEKLVNASSDVGELLRARSEVSEKEGAP